MEMALHKCHCDTNVPSNIASPRDAICLIARLFCQIGNKPPSAPHKEGGKEEEESSSPFFLPFPSGESRLEEGHHLHHHHPIGNIISRLRRRNDYLLCYTRMRESEEWVGMGRDLLTVSSQSLWRTSKPTVQAAGGIVCCCLSHYFSDVVRPIEEYQDMGETYFQHQVDWSRNKKLLFVNLGRKCSPPLRYLSQVPTPT